MTRGEYNREAARLEEKAAEVASVMHDPFSRIIIEAWRRRAQSYRELAKRETDEG